MFFFSSRRRHTRLQGDWSSDVCSSDLLEHAAATLREFVSREVLGRIAAAIQLERPQLRATLAASQLIGIAMLRYVVKVEPLASAGPDEVARWAGPVVQRYLTDPAIAMG